MDKLDAEFQFGRQALDLRADRQQLISANIANADTPGYKSRDFDFAKTLMHSMGHALGSQAAATPGTMWASSGVNGTGVGADGRLDLAPPSSMGADMPPPVSGGGTLPMEATHPGHLAGLAGAAAAASASYGTPQYRVPYQASMDGNTVELDTERVNFADNAMHYETGLTVINQQIKTMLSAVSGGNS